MICSKPSNLASRVEIRTYLRESDANYGTTSREPVRVPVGPVTRARAKRFKEALNGLIQEVWAQTNSWRPIEHDPQGSFNLIQVLENPDQAQ